MWFCSNFGISLNGVSSGLGYAPSATADRLRLRLAAARVVSAVTVCLGNRPTSQHLRWPFVAFAVWLLHRPSSVQARPRPGDPRRRLQHPTIVAS